MRKPELGFLPAAPDAVNPRQNHVQEGLHREGLGRPSESLGSCTLPALGAKTPWEMLMGWGMLLKGEDTVVGERSPNQPSSMRHPQAPP